MRRILVALTLALALAAPGEAAAAQAPTMKQFRALKAQVKTLKKRVNALRTRTRLLEFATYECLGWYVPASRFTGYQWAGGVTTALDVDDTPSAHFHVVVVSEVCRDTSRGTATAAAPAFRRFQLDRLEARPR